MKKFVSILLVTMICISLVSAIVTVLRYEKYVKTSQELLWDLEALCEAHDIDWGDTICEGDSWDNYCDARKDLGMDYLQHHSKRSK